MHINERGVGLAAQAIYLPRIHRDGEGMASSGGKRRKVENEDAAVSGVKQRKAGHEDLSPAATPSESGERFTFFFGAESPFSQWHSATFTVAGVKYNCAEQYMMHKKAVLFEDEEMAGEIMASSNPQEQKALGRKVKNFDDSQWKANCTDIVKRGNLAKFSQNDDLRAELMMTRGTTLVEAAPRDTVWGIGLSAKNWKAQHREHWRGTNLLGEILTEVREELQETVTTSHD